MADVTIGMGIKGEGQVQSGISNIADEMDKAAQAMLRMDRAQTKTTRSSARLTQFMDKMRGSVKRANDAFQKQRAAMNKNVSTIAGKLVPTYGDAAGAIRFAAQQIERAGQVAGQSRALEIGLARQGKALNEFLDEMKGVSRGTVSQAKIVESSGRALLLGIPAEEMAQLMEVARASAIATGQTTSQAFEDLAVGIGRASPMILDNLGFTIKLGEVYDKAAGKVGKTADQLSGAERKTALLNEILEQGEGRIDMYGEAHSRLQERLDKAKAVQDDFNVRLGEMASRAIPLAQASLAGLLAFMGTFAQAWLFLAEKITGVLALFPPFAEKMGAAQAKIREAQGAVVAFTAENAKSAEGLLQLAFMTDKEGEAAVGAAKKRAAHAEALERERAAQQALAEAQDATLASLEKLGVVLDVLNKDEIAKNNALLVEADLLYRKGVISREEFAQAEIKIAEANRKLAGTEVQVEKAVESTTSETRRATISLSDLRSASLSLQGVNVSLAGSFDQVASSAGRAATASKSATSAGRNAPFSVALGDNPFINPATGEIDPRLVSPQAMAAVNARKAAGGFGAAGGFQFGEGATGMIGNIQAQNAILSLFSGQEINTAKSRARERFGALGALNPTINAQGQLEFREADSLFDTIGQAGFNPGVVPSFGGTAAGQTPTRLLAASPTGATRGGAFSSFAKGVDELKQNTMALLHKGERVVPAETNKDLQGFMRRGAGVQVTINMNGPTIVDEIGMDRFADEIGRRLERRMGGRL